MHRTPALVLAHCFLCAVEFAWGWRGTSAVANDAGDVRSESAVAPEVRGESAEADAEVELAAGTGVKCRQTTYTLSMGAHTQSFVLPAGSGELTQQCNMGEFKEHSVKFFCADGTWQVEEPWTCADCLAASFTQSIGHHSQKYQLPYANVGKKKVFACSIGPYTSGSTEYECGPGGWKHNGDDCKISSGSQCPGTSYTLRMGEYTQTFKLSLGSGEKTQQCNMGDLKKHSVKFICADGTWQVEEPWTCADCLAASFTQSIGHHSQNYELPYANVGKKKVFACSIGPYTSGSTEYECGPDGWKHNGDDCKISSGSQCPGKSYTLRMGEYTQTFELSQGSGEKTQQCNMGDLKKHSVNFICAGGTWQVEKPWTCADCTSISVTKTINGHSHTYKLPYANVGKKEVLGCYIGPYTSGSLEYECGQQGWEPKGGTCKQPQSSSGQGCDKVYYPVTRQGVEMVYSLGEANHGFNVKKPCPNDDRIEILFRCRNTKWEAFGDC